VDSRTIVVVIATAQVLLADVARQAGTPQRAGAG